MQKRLCPRRGDVLLAKNGTTGMGAIVDRDINFDIYVSLALLRSKGDVLPEFLLEFINSKLANEQLEEKMSNWKDEIELRSKYILKLKDSLELEKPLLTKELIEDRLSEIEFEQKYF